MPYHISKDVERYRQIVRGKIRKDLGRYISDQGIVGRHGKKHVKIPLPHIDIPRISYGDEDQVGEGKGSGKGPKAGDKPGDHYIEVDVTMDELAKMLGEELELPNIKPKGKKQIQSAVMKYRGISVVGPESLRHIKRTFKEALKRAISSGEYKPGDMLIPIKKDKRYRTFKTVFSPVSNALIIYVMDISGSMGEHEKRIVRTLAFWIDTWIRHNYKHVKSEYIAHDTQAYLVPRDSFYNLSAGGGTFISAGLQGARKLMSKKYTPSAWNTYVFYFGDGDNWSSDDTKAVKAIKTLSTVCNQVAYTEIGDAGNQGWYSGPGFIKHMETLAKEHENLVYATLDDLDDTLRVIKTFLKGGR